uniref:Uncharacterized protein n=1 Tax=Oryza sativa subsp. japonica TaxID=39947 RepID=Q5Z940_ORYSJ|nr:hypothetical protein [Oryza sativa Japonica Group]
MYTLTSLLEGVANPFLPAGASSASSPACYPLPSLPPALTATMWRLSAVAGDVVLKQIELAAWVDGALSRPVERPLFDRVGGGPCRTPPVRQASRRRVVGPVELPPFDR